MVDGHRGNQPAKMTPEAIKKITGIIENTIVHIRLHVYVVLMEMEKQQMSLAKYREPCPAKIEYIQISPIFR
jgi:uncharacterized membrane protein YqjE